MQFKRPGVTDSGSCEQGTGAQNRSSGALGGRAVVDSGAVPPRCADHPHQRRTGVFGMCQAKIVPIRREAGKVGEMSKGDWILVLFALPYGILLLTFWWIATRALRKDK